MKKELCAHCGASMMINSYSMNRTLVRALSRLVLKPGRARDSGMSKSEYSVYTKLKFWGFIRRLEDGLWDVTDAGRDFLRGKIPAHKEIFYFRDRLVETKGEVYVGEVLPTEESKQKYREMMVEPLGFVELVRDRSNAS